MATTLLDQVKISPAIRTGAKYRTSETAEWVIPLKGDAAATTARIVVLIDGTETTAETANLNTRTLRVIHQILTKEQWQGRSLRNQVIYALERANKWLYDQALETHNVGRLGASIMVALFTDRNGITVELLHVGTCRALLIRGGERYQLTIEHTRGADFAAKTGSTISDWSPTRFLGAASTVEVATNKALVPGGQLIDRSEFQLELRDRLLLCSVGVKPVAVERFRPYMPESRSRTIAQELVGYQNESAIGNAAAIVAARDGARRRLPYVVIGIALLALAALLFWPQLSQFSTGTWSQLAQMLGLETPTPTTTASLEPPSTPITTTVAMTTTVAVTVTVTVTAEPTVTATRTPTAVPTASPTRTATATPTATATATTAVLSALVTPTPTPTYTPVPTATRTPISTATFTPISTLTPATTLTPVETLTSEATATAELLIATVRVTNLKSEDFGNGIIRFSWMSNIKLPADQGFVVVITRRGDADLSDPNQAFGLHAPTQDNFVKLNITALSERSPDLLSAGISYFWGIRLERKPEGNAEYDPVPNQFWRGPEQIMIQIKSPSDKFGKETGE